MNDTITTLSTAQPFSLQGILTFIQNIFKSIFSFGFLGFFYVLLSLLTIALITLILFLFVRMYEIRMEDKRKKSPVVLPTSMPTTVQGNTAAPMGLPVENTVWKGIREKLLGDNQSEWKLAVIEADIYMDKMLDDKGFHGDTTGDKLKAITPDRLPSVQIAWEVHKIRNRIAHDGAAFVLTMPEVRRMLASYEMIFTDLGVI